MNQIHHNLSEPTHLVMAVRVGCMYTQSVYFNCLYSRKLLAIFKTIITKKIRHMRAPTNTYVHNIVFCSLPLSKMSIYECMILECGILYVLVYKRCQKKCWARFQYAHFFSIIKNYHFLKVCSISVQTDFTSLQARLDSTRDQISTLHQQPSSIQV